MFTFMTRACRRRWIHRVTVCILHFSSTLRYFFVVALGCIKFGDVIAGITARRVCEFLSLASLVVTFVQIW